MISFVLVLRSGGDFALIHAMKLTAEIHKHAPFEHRVILYTDADVVSTKEMEVKRLAYDWPREWAMMEAYRQPGPAVYLDLDTVIVDDLSPLAVAVNFGLLPGQVIMLDEWGAKRGKEFAIGLVAWRDDLSFVTEEFARQAERGRFTPNRVVGRALQRAGFFEVDGKRWIYGQSWLPALLAERRWKILGLQTTVLPDFVESYKLDLNRGRTKPRGSIVVFHGEPRPWDVGW